jgi:Ca2+-transporting ATPase
MEGNLMLQKPRPLTSTFFNIREIIISIIQGIAITIGLLFIYQYCVFQNCTENETRTVVFLTLIASNIFLTLANRSFYYSILTTLKYKNNLVPMIIGITVFVTALLLFIPAFSDFFKFDLVSTKQIALSIAVGGISVLWIEIYKGIKRMKKQ